MSSTHISAREEMTLPTAGLARNAQLTALTGLTLLALFTAEIVTVILGVSGVMTAHAIIGIAITPVVSLKIGSTGWRFAKYYRGDRDYARRGAPPTWLRILGPLLITATLLLLGSGILAYASPRWGLHHIVLGAHKVLFYPWMLMLIAHTAAHFREAMQRAVARAPLSPGRGASGQAGRR